MTEDTIVAVYDSAAQAEAAVAELHAAGIPASAIAQHTGTTMGTTTGTGTSTGAPVREAGFWASLFGGEPEHDTSVYDRSIDSGSTVVTVRVAAEQYDHVSAILEKHDPIDLDERSASYGDTSLAADTTAYGSTAGLMSADMTPGMTTPGMITDGMATAAPLGTAAEETIQLTEETLAVGKRAVIGGTTRIRRYVVETPVTEQVTLHSENVTLVRRPVVDGTVVGAADFSDRTIEMTETSEEAVIAKTARVVEEVGLRRESSDRVETVKDTVRRDEVEIVQVPGKVTTAARI